MDGVWDITTPLSTSVSLLLNDGSSSVDSTEFCKVIGALQYLSFTRPDISFAVNKLFQFMHHPTQIHWTTTKRLLRYLKNTIFYGISMDDRKSTSAYLLFLGTTPISWSLKSSVP